MCRDSSVSIATRYGLDVPGIESQRGRDFPHSSRPALEPTQPPIQWVPKRGVDHPTSYSAEVKKRVDLYLYSTSGSSWPVLGWTLSLPLPADTSVRAKYGTGVKFSPSLPNRTTTNNCSRGRNFRLSLARQSIDSTSVNTNLFTKQQANLKYVIAYRGAHLYSDYHTAP